MFLCFKYGLTLVSFLSIFLSFRLRVCLLVQNFVIQSLLLDKQTDPRVGITLLMFVQDEKENSVSEYFGFISYCAYKCQAAETLCIGVAAHLNKIANDFVQNLEPSNLILRIYAIGLYFINSINQSKDSHSTSYVKAESINKLLLDERDRVLQLASLLGSLRSYFCSSGFFIASRQKLQSYLNALEFLCQPLAEFINLEKKEILSEEEVFPFLYKFCEVIQETFHQYCDVFFFCHRYSMGAFLLFS